MIVAARHHSIRIQFNNSRGLFCFFLFNADCCMTFLNLLLCFSESRNHCVGHYHYEKKQKKTTDAKEKCAYANMSAAFYEVVLVVGFCLFIVQISDSETLLFILLMTRAY